jgi:hypothetical protein
MGLIRIQTFRVTCVVCSLLLIRSNVEASIFTVSHTTKSQIAAVADIDANALFDHLVSGYAQKLQQNRYVSPSDAEDMVNFYRIQLRIKFGARFEEGADGFPVDYHQAMVWYLKAATDAPPCQSDAGHDPRWVAEYRVGKLYAEGKGVPQDLNQARAWMRRAACIVPEAQNWLTAHQEAPSLRSTPSTSVATGTFVFDCPENDRSSAVYTIDTDNRTMTVEAYSPTHQQSCKVLFRDNVVGQVTSPAWCPGPASTRPSFKADLALSLFSGIVVRQHVVVAGPTVSYGGTITDGGQGILGQMLTGQSGPDARFNLRSGVLTGPDGSSVQCHRTN